MLLPRPWRLLCAGPELDALQGQYEREITSVHRLSGMGGQVSARSTADDDVLVQVRDGRFAIVHLTWGAGSVDWPTFVFCDTVDAVRVAIVEYYGEEGWD